MLQGQEPITAKDFNKGLVTRSDILSGDMNRSPDCIDVRFVFDNSFHKRLGSSTANTIRIGSTPTSGFILDNAGTLTTNLRAYWKLDESSSTRFDAFGTTNLSDINSTLFASGIRGQAALFSASNSQGLYRATTGSIESSSSFSIESWFYLNSLSSTYPRTIISKMDAPPDEATALLLHCDGADASTTFTDSSPSGRTMTANGDAQIDTAQFKFGTGSALFDGTGDYLSTPNSSNLNFGTGDFTVDFWVRFNVITDATFLSKGISDWDIKFNSSLSTIRFTAGFTVILSNTWSPSTNTWYHIAITRVSGVVKIFVDGSQLGPSAYEPGTYSGSNELRIGADLDGLNAFNGWLDEIRITTGISRWSDNFTSPTVPYLVTNYEYWLFVNTDNIVTFRVSSSGLAENGTIRATSFGAVTTSTWYRVVAWHAANSSINIDVNLSANAVAYTSGVKIGQAPFLLGAVSDGAAGRANFYMDGRIDEAAFWNKAISSQERLDLYSNGSGNTFSGVGNSYSPWASFDFGASDLRWYTVAAGSGIYASSNLGVTNIVIATSRTTNYQYFERSKNVLIATSDSYDPTLYWAGSANTFAIALVGGTGPNAKYSINYNGFLVQLNTSSRKRGFFYADENLQLTDAWTNSFDIPSSLDDEITAPFILNKFLYISTRYKIYRTAFVGGNPDWNYLKVADFGFVPRTVKIGIVQGKDVAIGLDWQKRIRIFDGYNSVFASDNIENDNNMSNFAMSKISSAGSGLIVSNAEIDTNLQEYRLNVALGAGSTQTTHAIVLNLRTLAFYPYSNQPFNTMVMAESNRTSYLMAVDRSGFIHILNSGNLDASTIPINEHYDSPLMFKKTPSNVSKNHNIDFYFGVGSCGSLHFQERYDFSSVYSNSRRLKEIVSTDNVIQNVRSMDVPSVDNVYQFRLSSSSGTANPWELNRYDLLNSNLGFGKGGI